MATGLDSWIDEIAKKAGQVADGRGGFVRSYPVFEKDEWPETLTVWPCALTYTEDVVVQQAAAGPNVDMWRGVIEFHLVAGVKKSDFPYILRFFSRIRAVFAVDTDLGGRVQYCKLSVEGTSIEGPVVFEPGTDHVNQGLLAHWIVRERLS
jgi:hypothetical protein